MNPLEGQVVLITGVSSGIGWAAAEAFARRGCRLALTARRVEKLRELSHVLKPAGVETLEIVCDVRDPRQAEQAVEATVGRWDRLDVLVNNAGILEAKPFEKQDAAVIEDIMRTNYLGAVFMTRAALPHMRRQGRGHVVNVASIGGQMGIPYLAAYSASKFALVGLTESLRKEYYGTGITFTSLCPGVVDTPMTDRAFGGVQRRIGAKTPQQVAEKIVRAAIRRSPEIIYGEVPSFAVKLSRFFPSLTDWVVYHWSRRMRRGKLV